MRRLRLFHHDSRYSQGITQSFIDLASGLSCPRQQLQLAQHPLDTSQYVHLQYLHLQACMTDQMQGQSNAAAAQGPPVCALPHVTRILEQLLLLERS